MTVEQSLYGMIDEEKVYTYQMTNKQGIEITCINYGGRITSVKTPDKHGNFENIVLGYDTLEEYMQDISYQGTLCGRVSGRIGGASFQLDGVTYELAKNNGNSNLHGGIRSFSHVIWQGETFENETGVGVIFTYFSKDGEEGFPGNLEVKVTYLLNDENQFTISYEGVPDKKTIINMTNHAYFNLTGNGKETVLNHTLSIKGSKFLELGEEFIPTGQLLNTEGTPFDLRGETPLKSALLADDEQIIRVGQGIDHPFVLDSHFDEEIVLADQESGRKLIIETDQAAVVVYTGNQLTEETVFRGRKAEKYLGVCLETQGMPDAINHPHFQQVTVDKGEVYRAKTVYTFQ